MYVPVAYVPLCFCSCVCAHLRASDLGNLVVVLDSPPAAWLCKCSYLPHALLHFPLACEGNSC